MENLLPPTENTDLDEHEEDDIIIGYRCLGCGNDQDYDGSCIVCTGYSMEAIYF